jgi:YNFM family putative membrane transporter
MVLGSVIFATAIAASLIESLAVITASLVGACAGFSVQSAAVGLLSRRLTSSRGRANSLYVLCYYLGRAAGITACGYAYSAYGWAGLVIVNGAMVSLPFGIGLLEFEVRGH